MDTDSISAVLEEVVPGYLAESWDNVGWQVRIPARPVTGVLLALDATVESLSEAEKLGCNLLYAHHPLLFKSVSAIDLAVFPGRVVGEAIRRGISIWAAHTNLDVLPEGTSHALGEALGLSGLEPLARVERRVPQPSRWDDGRLGFGAVGLLPSPATTAEIAVAAVVALGSPVCQVAGDPGRRHRRVAVMGGSGASFLGDVERSGAALFITADVRYHEAQQATAKGIDLVILDHFATERPVLESVRALLRRRLPDLPIWVAETSSTPYVRLAM